MGCGYAQLTCLVPSHFQVYHSIVPSSSSSSSSTPHKTRKGTKRKKANNCSQFLENWPHSSCRPLFPPSLFFLLNSSIFLSTKDMKTCSWSFVAILMMRSEKKIKNVEEILEFATTLESNFIFLNHNILSKKCWKYTLKFIKNIWGGGSFEYKFIPLIMLAYYFHERCNFGLQTTTTTTKPKFFQLGWLLFFWTLIFARVQGRVSIIYQLGIDFFLKK